MISEIKQIFSISLIRDIRPFPLQSCSEGISHTFHMQTSLRKKDLRKRQEKTHHILGSLRPTLLAFTKYSQESCPVASHAEANPSLPLPRQISEPQRNSAQTFYFLSTICSRSEQQKYWLFVITTSHLFTEEQLKNLRLLSGYKSIDSRHFGNQHNH